VATLVADVKRYSFEDGPGIRSVVFFKGCPLRCVFCHNPEMQRREPELGFHVASCLGCGQCVDVCPEQAIEYRVPLRLDRDRCTACGRCAGVCPSGALRVVGRAWGIDELVELLLRDEPFYRHSGGGVTLSGGEPTAAGDDLVRLAGRLKGYGIHVALQTAGEFEIEWFCRCLLPRLDLIYFDLKLVDPEQHLRYTGRTNQRILSNLARLLRTCPGIIVPRIPLIPGVTATHDNLRAAADFLGKHGAERVVLLPYNPLGLEKAREFGYPTPCNETDFVPRSQQEAIRSWFQGLVATMPSRSATLDGADGA
jgi:pyruvate formate lyase activating enzyme